MASAGPSAQISAPALSSGSCIQLEPASTQCLGIVIRQGTSLARSHQIGTGLFALGPGKSRRGLRSGQIPIVGFKLAKA